ncbi:MAG: hypothetical protein KDC14_18460, partial [Planctomycetes bacterium]|nr:hypothetical protein [Planctomycetota bacterium]
MLAYVPHEAQRRVHESSAHTKVLACGARWGKSRCAVMELLVFALAPGPSRLAWIAAPRFEVVDKLLDLFVAQMIGGLAHRLEEVNRRARRIVVRNLSGNEVRIEGRNTERVPSLLGESLDYMLVDEAGRVRDEAWEGALSQRLVELDGRALVCGTPRNEGSWFHRLFARGLGEDPTVESWTGPTVDNPAIDPALVERERHRLSTVEFASEYLGQFVGPDGPLCLICGGPHRGCRSSVILPLGEVLAHCDACGRPLGRDGQPLGVPTPRGLYVLTLTT